MGFEKFRKKSLKTPLHFCLTCAIVVKTLGGPLWPMGAYEHLI